MTASKSLKGRDDGLFVHARGGGSGRAEARDWV